MNGWHVARRCRAWVALCLVLAALPSLAFESDEHRKISNLSVKLVLRYVETRQQQGPPLSAEMAEAVAALRAMGNDYAELVVCVDYLLYPEKLFTYPWEGEQRSVAEAADLIDVKQSSKSAGPARPATALRMPDKLRKDCKTEGAVWVQASHNNHAHFQQDLFVSLRLWHMLALQWASPREQDYARALIANAAADHYLQDMFAPGHIVTPREKLTDLPATATHDLANRMGVVFEAKLSPAIRQLVGFLCGGGIATAAPPGRCDERADVVEMLHGAGLAQVGPDALALLADQPVLFRGDNWLFDQAQDRQRLLLIAVQMRSLLDVIEGVNNLTTLEFKTDYKKGTAEATTDFGNYVFKEGMPLYSTTRGLSDPAATASVAAGGGAGRPPPIPAGLRCSFGGCTDEPYELKARAPIIGFSLQRESQSSGAYSARNLFNAELSTFNMPVDLAGLTHGRFGVVEVAPLILGYAGYRQGDKHGKGWTYRAAFTVPETDFSFGPYVRWLSYETRDGPIRRPSFGVRADVGFFGYFSLFVAGGLDYGLSPGGELDRGKVWTGGLRFGIPFTRLSQLTDFLR